MKLIDISQKGNRIQKSTFFQLIVNWIYNTFLPDNYPSSVSSDYLTYQKWDTLQAFFSSITACAATKATLYNLGVGDETATVLGASLLWLLKDGISLVCRIIFTSIKGSELDHFCKMWRLRADILNDLSFIFDLLGNLLSKSYIPYLLCISTTLRSIVGIAGTATRMIFTQHQAISNNIGDVNSKDAAQETVVNLVALILNIFLLQLLDNNLKLTIFIISISIIGHIFCNYRAVHSVVLTQLNMERMFLILHSFYQYNSILSPQQCNEKENVWWKSNYLSSIHIGNNSHNIDVLTEENIKDLELYSFIMKSQGTQDNFLLSHEIPLEPSFRIILQIVMTYYKKRHYMEINYSEIIMESKEIEQKLKNAQWNTEQYQIYVNSHRYQLSSKSN
ncbi:hypothetical protein SNEBB_001595 [Seison nebaliae]|nr:hypothetical protein SNEBB_001595 [Seison nebaliae]